MRVPSRLVPPLLLLAACGGDGKDVVPPPGAVHLFADIASWNLAAPRSPVLPHDVQARFVELLEGDGAVEEHTDAVWIRRERIDELEWKRPVDLELNREGLEFWVYRPKLPLALPVATLEHPRVRLARMEGRTVDTAANTYRALGEGRDRGAVVLALPRGAARDGFLLSYPTFPAKVVGHLRDFAEEPTTLPAVQDVSKGKQNRRCILLSPSMTLRRTVVVPPKGRLHFAICSERFGFDLADGSLQRTRTRSDGVGFRLTLDAQDGGGEVVWEEFLPPERAGRFHDQMVSLARYEGREVELEFAAFATAGDGPGADVSPRDALHDFAFLSEPLLAGETRTAAAGPNVLLVLLDTLRADALGCYGGHERTPVLDGLARAGVLFEQARSSSSWTLPAHASLFSSLLPTQHGILEDKQVLPERHATVAEVVRAAGWRTLAVTDGGIVSPSSGLAQGFDRFDHAWQGIARKTARLLDWIEACDAPFFAFLHTYEVHDPYDPRDDFRRKYVPEYSGPLPRVVDRWALEQYRAELDGSPPPARDIEYVRALYDAEVAYTDHVLGRLFSELRRRGIWDDTLVIVTSDHGEEFWEHGDFRHGHTLYEEMLRIPLIVHHPELFTGGRRVGAPVRIEDIAPTITRFLGIPGPAAWVGVPLTEFEAPRDVLAANVNWDLERKVHHSMYSAVRDGLKWIHAPPGSYRGAPSLGSQLFDLTTDPGERRPLGDRGRREAHERSLQGLLAEYPPVSGEVEEAVLSEEELEQLRGLGYVK